MFGEAVLQSVVRCELCNKPFDQQATLKRHRYYCRARRGGLAPRSRACISCVRRKARCDNKRPNCSRCITKAIECHYPAYAHKGTRPRSQHSDDTPSVQWKVAPSVGPGFSSLEPDHEVSKADDRILDDALVIAEPQFANVGEKYLDWGGAGVDFVEMFGPQTNDKIVPYLPSASPSLVYLTNPMLQIQRHSPLLSQSIPTVPIHNSRKLIQRPKVRTGAGRIASLILHTLKSYLVMLRHDTLPPFIHPRLSSSDEENKDMEPLTNCLSLVHMLGGRVPGNRKYFWKNVRLECERLCAEHVRLNRWGLLAALQALSIYTLVRLDEGETDHNNFDLLLVTTVTVISAQFNSIYTIGDSHPTLYRHSLDPSWKDWIFEESARRLCLVYQIVDMLVYFEPAAMCHLPADLVLAPLPAKKQLWEASDEFLWKAESEKEAVLQKVFGLATNGDLVSINEGQLYGGDTIQLNKSRGSKSPSWCTANWEEWCSGMDGLGGLVMLAASLMVK